MVQDAPPEGVWYGNTPETLGDCEQAEAVALWVHQRGTQPPEGTTMVQQLKCGLTIDDVMQAVEEDEYTGFCTACGEEAYNVEPDACRYTCESCGEPKVYGAQELLLMMA